MKKKYMAWNVTFMLWRCFVIFLNLLSSDLITTLTYVLMDNCCPCFNIVCLAANVANSSMSTMKLESNKFLFNVFYKTYSKIYQRYTIVFTIDTKWRNHTIVNYNIDYKFRFKNLSYLICKRLCVQWQWNLFRQSRTCSFCWNLFQ